MSRCFVFSFAPLVSQDEFMAIAKGTPVTAQLAVLDRLVEEQPVLSEANADASRVYADWWQLTVQRVHICVFHSIFCRQINDIVVWRGSLTQSSVSPIELVILVGTDRFPFGHWRSSRTR